MPLIVDIITTAFMISITQPKWSVMGEESEHGI